MMTTFLVIFLIYWVAEIDFDFGGYNYHKYNWQLILKKAWRL
jgi:hypothetical protein